MNKTIYISDLDGTLLNKKRQVPVQSKKILNELIMDKNIHFSVATARTPATVEHILQDISMREKIVVMNGVALYDLKKQEYSHVEYIEANLAKEVIQRLGHWIQEGFIYTITHHKLNVYYNRLEEKGRKNFYEERKDLEHKKFIGEPIKSYEDIIYFVFIDSQENIECIKALLEPIEGIGCVMYRDIYSKESFLLEVYSTKATKANGIRKLKKLNQYTNVICFGDQLNDLNMFEEADEAYAVGNAVKEVKNLATAVIGTNEEGSVAKFILEHVHKEEEKC